MSSAANNYDNVYVSQPPPEHHKHQSSDVLPGARGAQQPTVDYSADVTNDSGIWHSQSNNERRFGAGTDTGAVMAGGQHAGAETESPSTLEDVGIGRSSGTGQSDRPMNAQQASQGGAGVDGGDNLPEGHAKTADKLIGKTQKVAGKMMRKPALHEKGELREAGGKDAAAGRARVPLD